MGFVWPEHFPTLSLSRAESGFSVIAPAVGEVEALLQPPWLGEGKSRQGLPPIPSTPHPHLPLYECPSSL